MSPSAQADKVCFSRPGLPSETDYQTSFADAQLLHQYSHIIIKAKQTLNSTLRMLLAMCQHQDQLATAGDNASACEFRAVLEWCREQLEVHREGVYALEKHADQTMELLLRLLDHRRDVQMGQTGDVIRRDGMKMHAIAGSAGATLEEARSLLGSSAKHSERLGRLGWIATIYLPASFAAVSIKLFVFSMATFQARLTVSLGSLQFWHHTAWLRCGPGQRGPSIQGCMGISGIHGIAHVGHSCGHL